MQASSFSSIGAPPQRTGLIVAVVLALAAIAASVAMLVPPVRAGLATSASPGAAAAMVPAGMVGESSVAGDPSVPSAASVFQVRQVSSEEPPAGF